MRTLLIQLLLALTLVAPVCRAERSDEFLAGYISAILEQELRWQASDYELSVEQGVARITLRDAAEGDARIAQARERLARFGELRSVRIAAAPAVAAVPPQGFWRGIGEKLAGTLGVAGEAQSFPKGDVFWPLLADEKQPQFFVSLRQYNTPNVDTTVGAVAYGETFGLLRIRGVGNDSREGLQFSVAGALFAQFDLKAPSADLVNADYTIGAQATYRRGETSARVRLYHQSSHLGDEFLLRVQPERVNLSFESLEALVARQWGGDRWRAYAGGEYMLRREPEDIKRGMLHAGVEYYGRSVLMLNGRFIAGIDLKSYRENDWSVDRSIKAGLQFGNLGPGGRHARLLGEIYRGASQHGQFFDDKIDYFGLGLYLGF